MKARRTNVRAAIMNHYVLAVSAVNRKSNDASLSEAALCFTVRVLTVYFYWVILGNYMG